MIPKTLELLAKIAPGTFVPAAEPCYDEAEIKELALILKRLLYSPSERWLGLFEQFPGLSKWSLCRG
jgi:hypothetical protein